MIYEYALDPTLLSDLNNCRTIFENFRQENGKLISDSPRKWVQIAFQAINKGGWGPNKKKALKNELRKVQNESLVTGRNSKHWDVNDESWLEFIAKENNEYPYAAVISGVNVAEPVNCYRLDDLFLSAPDCWKFPMQVAVHRSATDLVNVMEPLLRISNRIICIDHHFYPSTSRYLNVFKEIITRSGTYNFGRGVNKLTIHTSDRRINDMQNSLQRFLLPHLPVGFEVIVTMWPENMMHDRYVVTDIAGLWFGHGLDEMSHDGVPEVNVKLIDNQSRKREFSRYSDTAKALGVARINK